MGMQASKNLNVNEQRESNFSANILPASPIAVADKASSTKFCRR